MNVTRNNRHKMVNRPKPRSRFVAATVYFALTASIAIVLLVTAAVVWLSELTGSFIISALIMGVFFAILATTIYQLAVKEGMERMRNQIDTIYEVARAVQTGYEWIMDKVLAFMRPHEGDEERK